MALSHQENMNIVKKIPKIIIISILAMKCHCSQGTFDSETKSYDKISQAHAKGIWPSFNF